MDGQAAIVRSSVGLVGEELIEFRFESGVDLFLLFQLLFCDLELVAGLLAETRGSLFDPVRAQGVVVQ